MDSTNIIVACIVAAPGILAWWSSQKNGRKIDKVHADVNGKVKELIAATKKGDVAEGKAEGVAQERQEARDRQTISPTNDE